MDDFFKTWWNIFLGLLFAALVVGILWVPFDIGQRRGQEAGYRQGYTAGKQVGRIDGYCDGYYDGLNHRGYQSE